MKKENIILLVTLLILIIVSFLLVKNQTQIVEWLPVDENVKFTLKESGVFIWVVIAPIIYVGALLGFYIPRVKKIKQQLENQN